ncbi:MAG: hypothetical protein ABW174_09735 [Flavitalea sp.]
MKKAIYALVVVLVVAGGLAFANRGTKNEILTRAAPKPRMTAENVAERKYWEASPNGIKFKKWEESAIGKGVLAGAAKIRKQIRDSIWMEAVVTTLTLPPETYLGFAVMARIDGTDYILRFDTEESQLEQLRTLKANDRLMIKVRGASMAPKYEYPIISAESVEKNHKLIYKHIPSKGGC